MISVTEHTVAVRTGRFRVHKGLHRMFLVELGRLEHKLKNLPLKTLPYKYEDQRSDPRNSCKCSVDMVVQPWKAETGDP